MIEVIITKNKDTKKFRKAFRDGSFVEFEDRLYYVTDLKKQFYNKVTIYKYTLQRDE